MVADNTFDYLVEFLYELLRDSVHKGYREEDISPKKKMQAELCDLFEHHIYLSGNGYFMLGNDGKLWVYNGKHYEKTSTDTLLGELVKTVLSKLKVGMVYQKFTKDLIARECTAGMQNRSTGRFIPNRRYIVFNNGVFDVKDGILKEFSIDYKTDIILDIDYNPSATHTLWDEKITSIIPNAEMREAFQQFCGMLLADRDEIKFEYICFVLGPGSNGKSVIADAVSSVFGKEYFSKFQPDQLLKDTNRMFNLASLEGKIGVFVDDLKKENISTTGFKSFASGDDFEARTPYGRNIFKVKAPLMLCCANEMPPTTDDSWGYHRRTLPIYSSTRIYGENDKDPNLTKKLKSAEARTAIFNWIYEGYKKMMANDGNIKLGNDVIEAQKELREDSNSVRRWIRDLGLVKIDEKPFSSESWKKQTEWHKMYREYCTENGDSKPQNSKSMSKIFSEKEFLCKRRSDGMWWCIGLKEFDTDFEDGGADNNPFKQGALPSDEELPF